jgi:nucleotide-binding universal stress UspA family protein
MVVTNTHGERLPVAYRRMLVPLSGCPGAEQVLPHVVTLARQLGSRVTLLRATLAPTQVLEPSLAMSSVEPLDPTPIVEADRTEADDYLARLADRLRREGLVVDYFEPEGPAPEAILDSAATVGADLIVIGSHGHGGLARLLFGDVPDAVLRHAGCPVVVVPVHEGPPQEDTTK